MSGLFHADVDEGFVRRRFESEFKSCEQLLTFIEDRIPAEVQEYQQIVLLIFMRATLTYRATLRLCSSGYVDQAQMLTRSLFEDMVMAYWVAENPDDAPERVVDQIDHMRLLRADVDQQHGGELPKDLQKLEERREELNSRFGRYGQKSWSGKNLFDTLTKVEHAFGESLRDHIWAYYDIAHKYNNQLLHLSAGGLSRVALDQNTDAYRLRLRGTPAALRGEVEPALFHAFLVYGALCGLFVLEFTSDVDEYSELFTRELIALAERVASGQAHQDKP